MEGKSPKPAEKWNCWWGCPNPALKPPPNWLPKFAKLACLSGWGRWPAGRFGMPGCAALGSARSLPREYTGMTLSAPIPALHTGHRGTAWRSIHWWMQGQLRSYGQSKTWNSFSFSFLFSSSFFICLPVQMTAKGDYGLTGLLKADVTFIGALGLWSRSWRWWRRLIGRS